MNAYKVYKLTCPNGRCYIGATTLSLNRRWQNGYGYKENKEFYSDILAYGWNNVIKEYWSVSNKEEMDKLERELIESNPDGYNRMEGRQGCVCYDKKGNFIGKWECLTDAGRETRTFQSHIGRCIRGERRTAGGYFWFNQDISEKEIFEKIKELQNKPQFHTIKPKTELLH